MKSRKNDSGKAKKSTGKKARLSKEDREKLGKGPIDISGTGSNYLESDFVAVD